MGSFIAIPVGELAADPLALRYGNAHVLLDCAIALIVVSVAASLVPSIRRLEQRQAIRNKSAKQKA